VAYPKQEQKKSKHVMNNHKSKSQIVLMFVPHSPNER